MSIIIAALAAIVLLAVAFMVTPLLLADRRMVEASVPRDVTSITLMGFGATLVLGVAGSTLWLGSVWA